MKLAIFYPRNTYAGWYTLGGYSSCLRRLGHEVLDNFLPGNEPHDVERIKAEVPPVKTLETCDAIISFCHEYTANWLEALYGISAWKPLVDKTVARFDESMDRQDLNLPARLPSLTAWAKYLSFPGAQDAKKYKGQYLPYASDTHIFKPAPAQPIKRKYGAAFVGQVYGPRMDYLERLAKTGEDSVHLHVGQVGWIELDGMKEPESTEILAQTYRDIAVFFCLPPMSRLLVAKVFDVMASGTLIMYPRLPGDAAENGEIFQHEEHLVYYQWGYVKENAKQIKYWLEDKDCRRERIARAGAKLVHEKYSLDRMLDQLLVPLAPKGVPAEKKEAVSE